MLHRATLLGSGARGCLLAAALAAVPACGKTYLLARVNFRDVKGRAPQRDVRAAEAYLAAIKAVKTVVFRVPEKCLTETAAAATGASVAASSGALVQTGPTSGTGAILLTDCAVWLAELERQAVQSGFRVLSWDALYSLEKRRSVPTYEAAKTLGADLVFVLNSLEAVRITAGAELTAEYDYFESDPRGIRGAAQPLPGRDRRFLRDFMDSKLALPERRKEVRALSAVLDTTAVLATSGESVWFYRWGVTRPIGESGGMRFLFRGHGGNWRPVAPEKSAAAEKADRETASHDVVTSKTEAENENKYRAELFSLVQGVTRDFVLNFRAGTS